MTTTTHTAPSSLQEHAEAVREAVRLLNDAAHSAAIAGLRVEITNHETGGLGLGPIPRLEAHVLLEL
ncbi:hypothetical protein EKE94_03315 [Mesobaculum littorinae]|uniref:Uncharacterized protein n=1 Tax=Mesobaculum littorinae TaxID=2486419 RepID=A0A438AM06_9RHOB|nr:hypothetical protein [Mesobaculum littorinae]RVV99722.1 hypothetical protein EKE94_03315 [Mesobaculum littorinae]